MIEHRRPLERAVDLLIPNGRHGYTIVRVKRDSALTAIAIERQRFEQIQSAIIRADFFVRRDVPHNQFEPKGGQEAVGVTGMIEISSMVPTE